MLQRTSNRRLLASVAAATFLLSQSPAAFAQESETVTAPEVQISQEMDGAYIVMWASANLRAAPSNQSDRLENLPLGSIVTVTGLVAGGQWYPVETADGTRGYVWTENLALLRMAMPGSSGYSGTGTTGNLALLPPSDDNHFGTARAVGDFLGTTLLDAGMVGSSDQADY